MTFDSKNGGHGAKSAVAHPAELQLNDGRQQAGRCCWPASRRPDKVRKPALPAVAPRHEVQVRPAYFFNGRPRQADVGEQPVIEFEKLPVLVSSLQPQGYSGRPPQRDFPPPSKLGK
jgi:hypothetical protein